MQSTGLKELLRTAAGNGFAVPSFNYSDIWDFLAIVEAAEEEHAPILIASNPLVVKAIGVEICGAIGSSAMKKASVPLFHHLDHSSSVELCKDAIDNGYPSVMIDGSKCPLEENIDRTRQVIAYARKHNVHVEAELGRIKGKGIEGDFDGGEFLADVNEVIRFTKETDVDSLAVGIGTAHGFYKGKPEIHFDRLAEIHRAVDTPLVLHGGTGIPEEDIRKAIRNGISKVNVGTIIHCTYMNNLREELIRRGPDPYTLDVVPSVREKIRAVVKSWIRVCGANGKA